MKRGGRGKRRIWGETGGGRIRGAGRLEKERGGEMEGRGKGAREEAVEGRDIKGAREGTEFRWEGLTGSDKSGRQGGVFSESQGVEEEGGYGVAGKVANRKNRRKGRGETEKGADEE